MTMSIYVEIAITSSILRKCIQYKVNFIGNIKQTIFSTFSTFSVLNIAILKMLINKYIHNTIVWNTYQYYNILNSTNFLHVLIRDMISGSLAEHL